jgi:thiol-disulfide isomerase/thioredoxin
MYHAAVMVRPLVLFHAATHWNALLNAGHFAFHRKFKMTIPEWGRLFRFFSYTKLFHMKLLILLILLLSMQQGAAQRVAVSGHIQGCADSMVVWAYLPVDGFYNPARKTNMGMVLHEQFQFETTISSPCFIVVENKCFKSILLLSPGDSVHVDVEKSVKTFTGSNAKGQQYLNTPPNIVSTIFAALKPIFERNTDGDSFSRDVIDFAHTGVQRIKDLQQTDAFTTLAIADFESYVTFLSVNQLMLETAPNNKEKTGKLSKEAIKKAIANIYAAYDPFLERYRTARVLNAALVQKCGLIKKDMLPAAEKYVLKGQIPADAIHYTYTPVAYQQLIWGTKILVALEHSIGDRQTIDTDINYLRLNFPQSQFIPMVETELALKFGSKSEFETASKWTHFEGTDTAGIIRTVPYSSLEDLVKIAFPGKPVFVDLWATWCAPCRAQFKYEDSLSNYLHSKNIEMLYVSLDSGSNADGWEKFIRDYKLRGFHYMPAQPFIDALSTTLSSEVITIPRYLLFNSSGQLVSKELAPPSSGEQLFGQISKALN